MKKYWFIESLVLMLLSIFVVSMFAEDWRRLDEVSEKVVGKTPEGFHRRDMKELIDTFKATGEWQDPYDTQLYHEKVRKQKSGN